MGFFTFCVLLEILRVVWLIRVCFCWRFVWVFNQTSFGVGISNLAYRILRVVSDYSLP